MNNTTILFTIIIVLIILLLLGYALICEANDIYRHEGSSALAGGNGKIHYKGFGTSEESLDTLLNRIYWVADSDGRNSKWKRALLIAVVSTFLICLILFHRVPTARELLLILLIIFITTLAVFGFFRFHADRFTPYYIRQNVTLIRQRLGYSKPTDPGPPPAATKLPTYSKLSSLCR